MLLYSIYTIAPECISSLHCTLWSHSSFSLTVVPAHHTTLLLCLPATVSLSTHHTLTLNPVTSLMWVHAVHQSYLMIRTWCRKMGENRVSMTLKLRYGSPLGSSRQEVVLWDELPVEGMCETWNGRTNLPLLAMKMKPGYNKRAGNKMHQFFWNKNQLQGVNRCSWCIRV